MKKHFTFYAALFTILAGLAGVHFIKGTLSVFFIVPIVGATFYCVAYYYAVLEDK